MGTFAPALLLIPAIGTQRTLLCAALLVSFAAIPLLPRRAPMVSVVVAGLLLIPPGTVKAVAGAVLERETQYQYVQVVRTPDGRTALRLDDGIADQSVYRPTTVLTGGEWDMPLVVPPLLDRPMRRALIIGNAGGTMARALAHEYPGRADRRRRARPRRQRHRPPADGHGVRPRAARHRGGRPRVPGDDVGSLRPHHRRRLPAGVRARSGW